MSNSKTGVWSALGSLLGGALGAVAGRYVAESRPRVQYAAQRGHGSETEDAMVIGGATGAVLGAFIGGAAAGEDPPQPCPTLPGK